MIAIPPAGPKSDAHRPTACRCRFAGRCGLRHRRVYESRASPRTPRGQTRGYLGIRLCRLRDVDRARCVAGDTASDSIARILEREPDWTALPPATPVPIRRLLFRCLAKDSKRRLRDVGDVRIEIDAINEVIPNAADVTFVAVVPTWKTWLPWGVVAALAAVVAGIGWWEARRQPIVEEAPLANARFSYFTNWDGVEAGAEISPDGKFVAFKADAGGQIDLWVSQVGTWYFTNLTQDMPTLSLPGESCGLRDVHVRVLPVARPGER